MSLKKLVDLDLLGRAITKIKALIPSAATANPKMDGTAAVGSSAKYAKEDHVHPSDTTRVAMTGNQTVAGNKTFSGTTSLTPESIYPASMGTAIPANNAAIIQSPIPKYLWHDLFAFCRDCTPKYYTTTNGSTWTQATLEKNVFAHKMTWGRIYAISDAIKGSRWIWETTAWSYGNGAWLLIGFSYTARNAYFDILFEGADSSGNWTTLLSKTNCYYNSTPVWFKTNGPADVYQYRLTIIRNSGDATTNSLPITSIRWLASRWGDQGRGEELEYPYQWDSDNNILPITNNTSSLGTSSYKWKNINVGQLNGTTIPASPKFTDTTYASKAAASGGTDVSLVTTGEKYTWNNKGNGTITGIKMNGASKGTSGVVDLGKVITAHQSLSGKQDKLVSGTNIKTINGTSILGQGNIEISSGGSGSNKVFVNLLVPADSWINTGSDELAFRASIPLPGVTTSYAPIVTFTPDQLSTYILSPMAETYNGGVYIYSDELIQDAMTIPSIICIKGD